MKLFKIVGNVGFGFGLLLGMTFAEVCFAAEVGKAAVQEFRYQAGDKIWYKKSSYPEVWEEGVYLRGSANGGSAVIRQKPNQYFKEGFETGAALASIRPLNQPPETQGEKDAKTAAAAASYGTGLMSETDLLTFLQTRLGLDKSANLDREQIKKELALIIKRRGLDFRYQTGSDFSKQASKYGLSTEVSFALQDNFGPPTEEAWLMGAWNLSKISTAVDFVKKDALYRQNEFAVGNVGTLTLDPKGEYVWQYSDKTLRGAWRKATAAEMKSNGGAGVVLLKAKSEWDWIVMQNRGTTLKGSWISISGLNYRQVRETGTKNADF